MQPIPINTLKRALRSVVFSSDTASSRYALGNVYIEHSKGKTNFVCTDGRRLAVFSCVTDFLPELPDCYMPPIPQRRCVLLSSPDVKKLIKAIGVSAEGNAKLDWCFKPQSKGSCGELRVTWAQKTRGGTSKSAKVQVNAGRFPYWNDVVFSSLSDNVLTCKADALAEQLPDPYAANYLFDLNGRVDLSRKPITLGDVNYDGDNIQCGLSVVMLKEWLDSLDDKADVSLHFPSKRNTAVIGVSGDCRYVQMPVEM